MRQYMSGSELKQLLQMFPTNYEVYVRLKSDEDYYGQVIGVEVEPRALLAVCRHYVLKIQWQVDPDGETKTLDEIDDLLKAMIVHNQDFRVEMVEVTKEYQNEEEGVGYMYPERVVAVADKGDSFPRVFIEVE